MNAKGVWFGNTSWPGWSSPGAFARDVFKMEGCTTDREKAMVFNDWFLRCMNRGPNLNLPAFGSYGLCLDPTILFTSWSHNECSGWGWVAAEALQAAGLKARRSVAFANGHTFYEVWYEGLDGVEGWHAFDPFIGWYYLNDSGEVASCEELAANPDLVTNPREGGRARNGHHPERSGVTHRYKVHDNLNIEQPVQKRELRFEPRVGQVFTALWQRELPTLAMMADATHKEGAHCDITLYDEEGKARYPEHLPYWKHYVWPTPKDVEHTNGGMPVRWHGSGAMRWSPLKWAADVVESAHNASFEKGTLRPTGIRDHCEVWWKITLPHLASYLRLNVTADASGSDTIGFTISPDGGKTLRNIHWGNGVPPKMLTVEPRDEGSVNGCQEIWLRVDMSMQSEDSALCLRGLDITVGYQLNMNILPRLVPGDNELYLQADELNGVRLEADWAFTSPDGEVIETVSLNEAGRSSAKVHLDIKRPDDIIMRGVTMRCLQKE